MLNKFIFYVVVFVTPLIGVTNTNVSGSCITDSESVKTTFVASGDARLFCRIVGKGEPLLVIHGGPGLSQDYLLPQMYELAKHNLVIFYDQRGCGKSTVDDINPNTVTIESFVDDIEAIRKAFNFDKISILGHSWGGFLALQYAIRYQEYIDKLILSNSTPATSEGYALFGQEYMRRMNPYLDKLEKIRASKEFREGDPVVTEQVSHLIFSRYCYNPRKAALLNVCMTSTASLNGARVSEIIRGNGLEQPFNLNDDLNGLKIPTLVLHGDTDSVPPITAKNIHENIPGSKYVLMKNCGHFPYVEDPTVYFRHISEFLHPGCRSLIK